MKKLLIILSFVVTAGCADGKPLIEITTDTTEIHHEPIVIDGHMIIQDTVIIEKVIEKTFPKATPEQKGDYGKIAAAFFSLIFVIMSVIWGKKRAKNG
jgi:hypothetical protein